MKMAEAVTLAKISGTAQVDEALGAAATFGRFATGDLASILTAATNRAGARAADETKSLTQGTAGRAAISRAPLPAAGAKVEESA
jgi:hypothetical protein